MALVLHVIYRRNAVKVLETNLAPLKFRIIVINCVLVLSSYTIFRYFPSYLIFIIHMHDGFSLQRRLNLRQ